MPYPTVHRGERTDGVLVAWPDRCASCIDRQCERTSKPGVQLCSYGLNFARIDDETIIAGFCVKNWYPATQRYQKELKKAGPAAVARTEVDAVLARAASLIDEVDSERRAAISQVVADYRASEAFKRDSVELLRPGIEQTLAQVHDYRSLISQIIQNVNVYLQRDFPNEEIEVQLPKSPPQIQSIYWAARLMEFKLRGPIFLLNPELITDPNDCRLFRLHGAVKKYLAMYEAAATNKNVSIRTSGTSFGKVMGNPDAVGVIYHAFIDNALKYAPPGSEVLVDFSESQDAIVVRVISKGPVIAPSERGRIFDLYQRGQHARNANIEGTGFGLGMARHVALHIGAELSVDQEVGSGDYRETIFTATFPLPTSDEMPSSLARTRVRVKGGRSSF